MAATSSTCPMAASGCLVSSPTLCRPPLGPGTQGNSAPSAFPSAGFLGQPELSKGRRCQAVGGVPGTASQLALASCS